jgi:hypothetical protein
MDKTVRVKVRGIKVAMLVPTDALPLGVVPRTPGPAKPAAPVS